MRLTTSQTAESWTDLYARALRGEACRVHGRDGASMPLPVARWRRGHVTDRVVLEHCLGPVLDVGCGPGRMVRALRSAGRQSLGIDVVPEAVVQARTSGATALVRDVFAPLPAEGLWESALLADGNIGIGGDPVRLLRRVRGLLSSTGRVVADLAPPGTGLRVRAVRLECRGIQCAPFPWATVGADVVAAVAARAGLATLRVCEHHGRWVGVLGMGEEET